MEGGFTPPIIIPNQFYLQISHLERMLSLVGLGGEFWIMCCHFPFFIFSYTNQTIKKKKTSRLFFSLAFSLRVVVNQRYQKKHFGYSILILKAALDILSDYQCSDDYIYKITIFIRYRQFSTTPKVIQKSVSWTLKWLQLVRK